MLLPFGVKFILVDVIQMDTVVLGICYFSRKKWWMIRGVWFWALGFAVGRTSFSFSFGPLSLWDNDRRGFYNCTFYSIVASNHLVFWSHLRKITNIRLLVTEYIYDPIVTDIVGKWSVFLRLNLKSFFSNINIQFPDLFILVPSYSGEGWLLSPIFQLFPVLLIASFHA
jgi:hypothetical protein